MYAWIGINFVLGRFDHVDDSKCIKTRSILFGNALPKSQTVTRDQMVPEKFMELLIIPIVLQKENFPFIALFLRLQILWF